MNPKIDERPVSRDEPPGSQVRAQLARILGNEIFLRSERLSNFLRFVVERTLEGQSGSLKEQVLGSELYRKGPDFDGSADPIVRVDARRLRDKLREYYSQFPQDPILISLPKGSYVPVFQENQIVRSSGLPQQPAGAGETRWRRTRWVLPAIAAAAVLAVGIPHFLWHGGPGPESRAVLITSFPGNKVAPALSPDGRLLAFSSKGPEDRGEADIWVKSIDTGALRRLTETPQFTETSPAWSPNGRDIAFIRRDQGVFVVPERGGPERNLSRSGNYVEWAPDGKSVLIRDRDRDGPFGIYQVFLDTLERRCLTQPVLGDGDWRFSVSSDGSKLAFIRFEHPGSGDLYVAAMQGGPPRRITNWNGGLSHVIWTPDGRDLIYSKEGLWRISATLTAPGRGSPLTGIPAPASNLSISRPGSGRAARLVFQTYKRDLSFRIIDLSAPLVDGTFQALRPFAASKHLEFPGPFSPDSRAFAFVSGQPSQLWISNIEGSSLHQVTSGIFEPSPGSWSPDGRKIVYSATVAGNHDVFVVDTEAGSPKRLTDEPSIEGTPSWSRDGRWIYFSSTRAGAWPDIWRIPAEGGSAVRITYKGGIQPRESPDGKDLYYLDQPPPADGSMGTATLMKVPVAGGSETRLLKGLTLSQWSMAKTGIYFIRRAREFDAIDRFNFSDGTVSRAGRLGTKVGQFGGQMNVSPDDHWALVTLQHGRSDIMLVDNFR